MKKLLAIAFLFVLALIAYWADTGSMPLALRVLYTFPYGDLIGHFVLYGTLSCLLTAAFPFRRVRIGRLTLPLGLLLACGVAVLEEISQFFFATRTPDLLDLAVGLLGIALSAWIPCMRGPVELPHEDLP